MRQQIGWTPPRDQQYVYIRFHNETIRIDASVIEARRLFLKIQKPTCHIVLMSRQAIERGTPVNSE